MMSITDSGDSTELQDLFDSILSQAGGGKPEAKDGTRADGGDTTKMFSDIGHLTRKLHDALRQLGYDKVLEKTVEYIPDTRDRLSYVAELTEKAAQRVLTATETAQPLQERLESRANDLSQQWQRLFDKQLNIDEFKTLVTQTRDYLNDVPNQTKATNAQLMEIMMAQDFQDLTGQVIKKVTEIARDMEGQLLKLLVEYGPSEIKAEVATSLLNGPVINPEGRTDVVTNQEQVDDLLASLGF